MAPLPVITNTYRTAFEWSTSGGQSAVNVMHFRNLSGSPTAADLMTALDAHVTAAMWGMVSASFSVKVVAITPLDGSTATQAFTPVTPAHWVGGTGGDFMPAVSGLLSLRTILRGRSHRGRIYFPSPGESQVANGDFTDGTPGTTQTAWGVFKAAMQANSPVPWDHVVASYKLSTATGINSYFAETAVATQRRRQTRIR